MQALSLAPPMLSMGASILAKSNRKRRLNLSRQSLPALSFIILGLLMMSMPFIVKHSGYAGDVLVAHNIEGQPFEKTIVLIGQESVDGAAGIILNMPLPEEERAKLSPFIRDSGIAVGYGGPIETSEKLFVLEEKKINDRLNFDIRTWESAISTTPDLLDKIRTSTARGEQHYLVFAGYAAWGPFQLEQETLFKNRWFSVPADHDLIFQSNPVATWDALDRAQKAKALTIPNQT